MKTYQEYYDDWLNSTESRDLSFEEWLMLLLDRKEKEMIDKACGWLKDNIHKDLTIGTYADTLESLVDDFRKAMEE